jgi:hypothetical protein
MIEQAIKIDFFFKLNRYKQFVLVCHGGSDESGDGTRSGSCHFDSLGPLHKQKLDGRLNVILVTTDV